MTDRHQELRRQHELLREHLAWLEREIARETAENPPQTAGQAAPVPVAPVVPQPHAAALLTEDPDALLKSYADGERHNPESTKRGCLLIFAVTIGLLIIGVVTAYFLFYARR